MQLELDEVLLFAQGFQSGIVPLVHEKAFGRSHHGIHLRIPQETRNGEFLRADAQSFADLRIVFASIADWNIDLPGRNPNDVSVEVHQEVKALILHAQPIVLRVVRKRMRAQ